MTHATWPNQMAMPVPLRGVIGRCWIPGRDGLCGSSLQPLLNLAARALLTG